MTLPVFHADSGRIAGVSNAALHQWLSSAYEEQGEQLRADNATLHRTSASQQVEAQRVAVRQFAADLVAAAEAKTGGRYRVDALAREIEIGDYLASEVFGLRADSYGTVQSRTLRTDSYWTREQLTQRSDRLIRQNEQDEMVRTAIETRSVSPYAEYVQLDYVTESGAVAHYTPGQKIYPRSDFAIGRTERKMEWYVTSTVTDWTSVIYSSAPGALSESAEKMRIAIRNLERFQENMLIAGVPGIDAFSLSSLPIPRIPSSVNFGTATLGAKVADMTRMLQAVRTNQAFTGAAPSVGLIDPRLAMTLRTSNNIDAGGDSVGSGAILRAAADEGLRSIVEAPTMSRFFPSPSGSNYAQMLIWAPGSQGPLRQLVGMGPTPVSTAEYHGTETVFAIRHGGLEIGDPGSAAILDIQIS